MKREPSSPPERYRLERAAHFDRVARDFPEGSRAGRAYHRRLSELYAWLVRPGLNVLDVGCGAGDLLACVRPAHGVGVDFSPEMLALARKRYRDLSFVEADAHDLSALKGPFDVVILSDLLNDLYDVQAVLEQVHRLCHAATRVILNVYSHVWELPLQAAASLGLGTPRLEQNWLTPRDVSNLLQLASFELVRQWPEVLFPLPLPGLQPLANRYAVRLWPFRLLALSSFAIARPAPVRALGPPKVSVIVPARNEAGNVPEILQRIPEMGAGTEIIFVEGHSRDRTYEAIELGIREHPQRRCKLLRQTGVGKGDAVRLGFAAATGDIVLILDADLTVRPEDLPRFVEVLVSGRGEFVNGVRLVYPMQDAAMRFLNLLGNKCFSMAFTWLLGQSIKDTLCGTKALWKRDYDQLASNRTFFGDFDPFGDFDLLFGAAKLGLCIVEMPVRYQARRYGETNIQRWRHGLLLLRMVLFAARRIKFV